VSSPGHGDLFEQVLLIDQDRPVSDVADLVWRTEKLLG
jgi:hypothetical protein